MYRKLVVWWFRNHRIEENLAPQIKGTTQTHPFFGWHTQIQKNSPKKYLLKLSAEFIRPPSVSISSYTVQKSDILVAVPDVIVGTEVELQLQSWNGCRRLDILSQRTLYYVAQQQI